MDLLPEDAARTGRRVLRLVVLTIVVLAALLVLRAGLLKRSAALNVQAALRGCAGQPGSERCRDAVMGDLYRTVGLEGALGQLRHAFAGEQGRELGQSVCHDVYHKLGVLAGAALGENAIVAGASECDGGYYHGVFIAETSLTPTVCLLLHGDDARNCWHGAGHASYSTQVEPEPTPQPCQFDGVGTYLSICRQGYFMEYAHARNWAVTVLSACTELASDVVFDCVAPLTGGVLTSNPADAERVLDVCADLGAHEATTDVSSVCWRAAGYALGGVLREQQSRLADLPERCRGNKDCREGVEQAGQWSTSG